MANCPRRTFAVFMLLTAAPAAAQEGWDQPPPPDMAAERWGPAPEGRWYAGAEAPGGWSAYSAPAVGSVLPGYWQQRQFAIEDWQGFGLRPPAPGYHWSRYYDDAVLIDHYGRVYDSAARLDWGHWGPDHPSYGGDALYSGTWDGSWVDRQGRRYDGTYTGTFRGETDAGASYAPPPYPNRDNWSGWQDGAYPGGTVVGGWYYPEPSVTTVVVQPGYTTVTDGVVTYQSSGVRHAARRHRPTRPGPHCGC